MMRQYKYMGINWKVNAEKDILGKMDCLLGDYYKESYAPKVDFEVTLVEKISSDLTEILEYGVPITIHNSKKPSVHEEGLVLKLSMINKVSSFNVRRKRLCLRNRSSLSSSGRSSAKSISEISCFKLPV